MVPPGCEGCQLALWVRCRRRRLVYIRFAIPLFSFFVHNHAPLSARYQMIKSSAACLPLDARLFLACCVYVSVCVCIHNSSATKTKHPSGTTYSYITKGYRLLARCVLFCLAFLPFCLVWSAFGSGFDSDSSFGTKVTPWRTHNGQKGGNKKSNILKKRFVY